MHIQVKIFAYMRKVFEIVCTFIDSPLVFHLLQKMGKSAVDNKNLSFTTDFGMEQLFKCLPIWLIPYRHQFNVFSLFRE